MAWTGIENFDLYMSGSALSGSNAGSGWGGAWANVTGTAWAVSNAQSVSSPNSAIITGYSSGTEPEVKRVLNTASNTSGDQVQFSMYRSSSNDNLTFYGYDATTYRWFVSMDGGGNISAINNTVGASIGSWIANTWYTFIVELDYANTRYRVSINGGAFSSYNTFHSAAGTSTTEIHMGVGSNNSPFTGYVDSIGVPAVATTPSRLTLMGVS